MHSKFNPGRGRQAERALEVCNHLKYRSYKGSHHCNSTSPSDRTSNEPRTGEFLDRRTWGLYRFKNSNRSSG